MEINPGREASMISVTAAEIFCCLISYQQDEGNITQSLKPDMRIYTHQLLFEQN